MCSGTQHNQYSTGNFIYKYILFRNFINSVWAPCVRRRRFSISGAWRIQKKRLGRGEVHVQRLVLVAIKDGGHND